jgi:tetratricopeptide (TPR) repeat protein
MKTRPLAIAFGLIVVLALAGPAWPQFQGRLEGTVLDDAGTPLAKVAITIVSLRTSSMHYELKTDAGGRFAQVGMMPGYYQISFKKEGYLPTSSEVHVPIADVATLQIVLKKGAEIVEKAVSDADRLFLKANKFLDDKKYEEAVAAYQEAIKLSPVNWGYYFNLGLAYKKLDQREDAVASFHRAVELNPDSFSANKEMGEALGRAGAFEEARPFFEKAVALSPDDPDGHFNLGVCLINAGQTDEALAHFLKTTELDPDYADAYYQIGTIYIGQNKVPEAVASLEKFLALAPSHEKAPLAKQILEALKRDGLSLNRPEC